MILDVNDNCRLRAAPSRADPQQRKDRLFICRLARDTRASDVMNYVEWLVSDLQLNIDLRGPHFQVQCKNVLLMGPIF